MTSCHAGAPTNSSGNRVSPPTASKDPTNADGLSIAEQSARGRVQLAVNFGNRHKICRAGFLARLAAAWKGRPTESL